MSQAPSVPTCPAHSPCLLSPIPSKAGLPLLYLSGRTVPFFPQSPQAETRQCWLLPVSWFPLLPIHRALFHLLLTHLSHFLHPLHLYLCCLGSGSHSLLLGPQQEFLNSPTTFRELSLKPILHTAIKWFFLNTNSITSHTCLKTSPGILTFHSAPFILAKRTSFQFPKPGKPIHTAALTLLRFSLSYVPVCLSLETASCTSWHNSHASFSLEAVLTLLVPIRRQAFPSLHWQQMHISAPLSGSWGSGSGSVLGTEAAACPRSPLRYAAPKHSLRTS